MKGMLIVQTELGFEKQCRVCREWWPLDEEFWYVKRYAIGDTAHAAGVDYVRKSSGTHWYGRCKACWSERSRREYAQRRRRAS